MDPYNVILHTALQQNTNQSVNSQNPIVLRCPLWECFFFRKLTTIDHNWCTALYFDSHISPENFPDLTIETNPTLCQEMAGQLQFTNGFSSQFKSDGNTLWYWNVYYGILHMARQLALLLWHVKSLRNDISVRTGVTEIKEIHRIWMTMEKIVGETIPDLQSHMVNVVTQTTLSPVYC